MTRVSSVGDGVCYGLVMLCNNPEIWLLGPKVHLWLIQHGLSECAISWVDSMAMGFAIVFPVGIVYGVIGWLIRMLDHSLTR